jgi:hypothetical protein
MAVTLNASTSNGLIQTADTSGVISLQANGTTVLTVNPANFTQSSIALGTAAAGAYEYNGYSPYFTPFGTSRGIVQASQYYELNTAFAGANVSTVQSLFGLTNGFTLQASTIYEFESVFALCKTAGTTSHTISLGYGGTATINNILVQTSGNFVGGQPPVNQISTNAVQLAISNSVAANVVSTASVTASVTFFAIVKGTVSINAAGTFLPQYTLSAAPGGAFTTQIGSYFKIAPLAASGANVSIGNVS